MHKFTDEDIFDIEVEFFWGNDPGPPQRVVMFSLDNCGEGPPTVALSKEDLLHLLKLIEEKENV